MMFPMTAASFDLVYNSLSFTMASMMASTLFFWFRMSSVNEKYKSAMCITGLVTFIAAYHYFRIFNSWVEAYEFPSSSDGMIRDPVITGKPFNDAYRYMDWLLTVPLLLIEIIFVCKLSPAETVSKAVSLGVSSGLMIILGYPGELIIEGNLSLRWKYWAAAMVPFLYVVHTLLVGLQGAIASEENEGIKSMLSAVCWATVISWCTYPVVYVFPMFGLTGAESVVAIQLGYCVSDIISKCGVGFLIYNITIQKSYALDDAGSYTPPVTYVKQGEGRSELM
jgi:bacteriorhodopsin